MQRLLGIVALLIGLAAGPAFGRGTSSMDHQVWFTPAEESGDLLELFTRPELWATVRPEINVFKIGPVLAGAKHPGPNGLAQFAAVGAFQRLDDWGIALALEAPAIKRWDCSGKLTLQQTLRFISNVASAGGQVQYISMDEPLASARRDCGLSTAKAADGVADYIKALRHSYPSITVGDIIAYPHFSASEIINWERMLAARGAQADFVHLDIDYNSLAVHRGIDYEVDLQALARFAHGEGIPLGVIFWAGRNPLSSDEAYYDDTLSWVKRIHAAIGKPDQAIFESWVTRSSRTCSNVKQTCEVANPRCNRFDPADCGLKSVPANLPDDNANIFSHTRLIKDSLRELNW